MNKLSSLQIAGKASATQAASDPQDYVRQQEHAQALSGVAPLVHQHLANDITDLEPALPLLLAGVLVSTDSITVQTDNVHVGLTAKLKAAGGILLDGQGLYLDTTLFSAPGHQHQVSDISGFASGVQTQTSALLFDSASIEWVEGDTGFSGIVMTKTQGGILVDESGLFLDFGPDANQVAPGNHTHTQLHDPVTLASSSTLSLLLNGQELAAELFLAALSGLKIDSGLAVDFGTDHNQAARGDHTHPGLESLSLAVANTESLALSLDDSSLLSGVVRLDAAPSFGRGKIQSGSAGLYVALGAAANTAAAGNHGHNAATSSSDGFMSAQDKSKLDGLGNAELIFDPPLLQSGTHVLIPPASQTSNGYMSAGDKTKLDALDGSSLIFSSPLLLSGHTVSLTQASASAAGYLSSTDWSNFNSKAAGNHTHSNATQSVAGFMSATDKTKLDGLDSSALTFDAPLVLTDTEVSLARATSSVDGYLSHTDWSTFNSKAAGNHTHSVATQSTAGFMSSADKTKLDGLSGDGGADLSFDAPLVLTGTEVSLPKATSSVDGYLWHTDWSAFAAKVDRAGDTMTGTLAFADNLDPAIYFGSSTLALRAQQVGSSWDFQILGSGAPMFSIESNGNARIEFGDVKVASGFGLQVDGNRVVSDRQPSIDSIGDPSTSTAEDCANKINEILGALRTHGLIALPP